MKLLAFIFEQPSYFKPGQSIMRRSSDEEQYKADNKKDAYFHPTCIVIVGIKVLATLILIKLLKINKYPESNTRRGTPYGKVTKAQENTTHKRATM